MKCLVYLESPAWASAVFKRNVWLKAEMLTTIGWDGYVKVRVNNLLGDPRSVTVSTKLKSSRLAGHVIKI